MDEDNNVAVLIHTHPASRKDFESQASKKIFLMLSHSVQCLLVNRADRVIGDGSLCPVRTILIVKELDQSSSIRDLVCSMCASLILQSKVTPQHWGGERGRGGGIAQRSEQAEKRATDRERHETRGVPFYN